MSFKDAIMNHWTYISYIYIFGVNYLNVNALIIKKDKNKPPHNKNNNIKKSS